MYTGGEISKVSAAPAGASAKCGQDPCCNLTLALCPRVDASSTAARHMQALGFCRASDRPEDQLRAVVGRTGLIRFWDCCGAEEEDAPGCCTSRHVTYDDPVE